MQLEVFELFGLFGFISFETVLDCLRMFTAVSLTVYLPGNEATDETRMFYLFIDLLTFNRGHN